MKLTPEQKQEIADQQAQKLYKKSYITRARENTL